MKKYKKLNLIELLFIILILFIINNKDKINNYFNVSNAYPNSEINTKEPLLKVHYLNVDQGDSIFIELPNKETMLIDAAESNQSTKIIN